jgi:hypothetical protein
MLLMFDVAAALLLLVVLVVLEVEGVGEVRVGEEGEGMS